MAHRILNKTAVMISDLHVGSPKNPTLEDFDRDADFERLLLEEIPARAKAPATLVIAGDFIDFPQILPELGKNIPWDRLGTTEDESLRRINLAIEGHPRVFAALRTFLERKNQVLILPGNHDVDLHFPRVFEALRAAAGNPDPPAFAFLPEGFIQEQGIHLEHGNQYSYDNWFEHWENPVRIAPDKTTRIERPWGTLFMDIVYNDIEDAYPFVNKVFPHSALAGIVLRLMRDDPKVLLPALARLVAFFVTRGKRALGGWALGAPEEAGDETAVTLEEIESFVDTFGEGMPVERRKALIEQTAALTGATEEAVSAREDEPVEGLLGQTDTRGLSARTTELLSSGTVSVVAFGHTHAPVDKTVELPGRVCRVFNTGGWIPSIQIDPARKPTLEELRAATRVHDLRYLVVELGETPKASLERLGAG